MVLEAVRYGNLFIHKEWLRTGTDIVREFRHETFLTFTIYQYNTRYYIKSANLMISQVFARAHVRVHVVATSLCTISVLLL